jgi:Polyprenyl synthetase
MSVSDATLDTEQTAPARVGLAEMVARRLGNVDLLPELRQTLLRLSEADEVWRIEEWQWPWVIPAVQAALGGAQLPLEPFIAAWTLMYAAIVRLDHLQDGESVDDPLALPGHTAAQYNLLLAYYVLASSLLDDLSPQEFPPHRIRRLYRLWSDLMLRTASGQQRDLIIDKANDLANVAAYHDLARAKTGSTFALAFGGVATLMGDDQTIIDACLVIGDLFGALVQYHDDVLDAAMQPNATLTLPDILALTYPEIATTSRTPQDFWSYLYRAYRTYVEQVLTTLPEELAERVLALFVRAFEQAPTPPGDTA